MADKKLNLLADFPAITTEQWMNKITTDLKGADFAKKLVWRTNEGFNVMPFYRIDDVANLKTTDTVPGAFPYVRGTKAGNDWFVRQDIDATDAVAANKKALDILGKGINSLGFKLNKKELNKDYIATLLNGICMESVELNFHVCVRSCSEAIMLVAEYAKAQGCDLAKLQGSVNCDPINRMLLKGKKIERTLIAEISKVLVIAKSNLPQYRVLTVNSVSLNNSGAYCAQELGYALAWGAEYMDILIENGVDANAAAAAIKFNMGVGGNYFMEIAKFRAARMLWAMIAKEFGVAEENAKMHIHATTSTFNKTVFDAHVNMLRTQTEAMSASLAGVDSLTVLPFDCTFAAGDDFSERIARNQQFLLKEESHFDKVVDPSAGSYYIETLTANIAEQAWTRFLEIANNGGFYAAVVAGKVQEDMQATSAKRLKDVSARKEVILGTNQFPNFNEFAASKVAEKECGCSCGCTTEKDDVKLPSDRAASEFEALRLATERSGKRPKAFMLTIGNLAMRLARAQFSCNFFACAGYEVIDNLGFETVEAGIKAAQAAGADIIVLCSSDDEYATFAPEAFNTIAGKQMFAVAGAPACADDLKAVGIEHFINVRTNVLETLRMFNAQLIK